MVFILLHRFLLHGLLYRVLLNLPVLHYLMFKCLTANLFVLFYIQAHCLSNSLPSRVSVLKLPKFIILIHSFLSQTPVLIVQLPTWYLHLRTVDPWAIWFELGKQVELKKVNKFSESEKKNVYIMEKEIKSLRDDENKKQWMKISRD